MRVCTCIQRDLRLGVVFLARKLVFRLPSSSERPALVGRLRLLALALPLALALLLNNSGTLAVFVWVQVRRILDLLYILA